jgi:HEAT repeat protein
MAEINEATLEFIIVKSHPDFREKIRKDLETLLGKKKSFEHLINILRDERSNKNERILICWLLGQLRNKRTVHALLNAFNDSDPSLFWEAAKSLGQIGSKRATHPLILILLKDTNPEKRAAAAYALGNLRDKRALHLLLKKLADENENIRVREHVAEALAYIKDESAVPPLIDALRDSIAEVRFWSAFALGEIGDNRALTELKIIADTDKSVLPRLGRVSKEASLAIERIEAKYHS